MKVMVLRKKKEKKLGRHVYIGGPKSTRAIVWCVSAFYSWERVCRQHCWEYHVPFCMRVVRFRRSRFARTHNIHTCPCGPYLLPQKLGVRVVAGSVTVKYRTPTAIRNRKAGRGWISYVRMGAWVLH